MNIFTKTLVSMAVVTSMAGAVYAGEGQGVIASIALDSRMIMLEDGSIWFASEVIDLEGLAAGDTIAVVYDDGTTNLTAVEKVQ